MLSFEMSHTDSLDVGTLINLPGNSEIYSTNAIQGGFSYNFTNNNLIGLDDLDFGGVFTIAFWYF